MDCFVKPVAEERLLLALERVRERRAAGTAAPALTPLERGRPPASRMAIRSGSKYVVFDPRRVCAILSQDHYSAVQVDGRELLADDPLDALAARLDPERFLRIHRSAVVNLDFIKELQHEGDRRYTAVLNDAKRTRVPVVRDRLPALKAKLGIS